MAINPLDYEWIQKATRAVVEKEKTAIETDSCGHPIWITTNNGKDGSKRYCASCNVTAKTPTQKIAFPETPAIPPAIKSAICDHVWVNVDGGPMHCAKCNLSPVKKEDILGAKQALQEKTDSLKNKIKKQNELKMFMYTPLPTTSELSTVQDTVQKYYDTKMIKALKAGISFGSQISFGSSTGGTSGGMTAGSSKPANDGFKGAGDAEKFAKKIGVLSNINVDLQGKGYGFSKQYRLHCDKCDAFIELDRKVADSYDIEHESITTFCKAHRHEITVVKGEKGRKFRDDQPY